MIGRLRRWCAAWALWQAPRRVFAFVLTIDVLAIVAATITSAVMPITRADLGRFAILVVCAWIAIELTRHIERKRELARRSSVAYIDTKTVWSFAAVIILPLALASAIVVISYVLQWSRVRPRSSRRIVHRWVFNCATVLCGTQVAALVLAMGMGSYPGTPATSSFEGLADVGIIALAGLLRWVINAGLVMAAIAVSDPTLRIGDLFSNHSEYFLEAGAAGLGLVTAVVMMTNTFVLPGIVLAMVALHRSLLVSHYQRASRTDAKTGLASVARWHEFAEQTLVRARERDGTVGLLILDLDHFKTINDTYGHPFGDEVLRAVADEIRAEIRDDDACGRWGGEEFAIVLVDVETTQDLHRVAERVRRRVEAIVIAPPGVADPNEIVNVTASVGGAIYPMGGITTLDELLLAADSALYEAKNAGRNTVRLSSTTIERAGEASSEVDSAQTQQQLKTDLG